MKCIYCKFEIPEDATVCGHCTRPQSVLEVPFDSGKAWKAAGRVTVAVILGLVILRLCGVRFW